MFQMGVKSARWKGAIASLDQAGYAPADTAQCAVSLHHCQGALLTHV